MSTTTFIRVMFHLFLIRPLMSIFFGVNTIGVEYISKLSQCIIISNHNSHIDILLLFHILTPKKIARTRIVAAADYFARKTWLCRIVTFLFNPIWVDRNKQSCSAISEIIDHLRNKGSIIMFPEGTRGDSDKILDFKEGIGLLTSKYPEIPVVPVYLQGPERAFPKNRYIPLPLLNFITVSPPQTFSGNKTEITKQLFYHLKRLADEERQFLQRKKEQRRIPSCVAVIGIDGSGKSTLAKNLASTFPDNCCFIGDSLEFYDNGVKQFSQPYLTDELRRWLGRKAKKAKKLSSYKFPKIAELFLRDHLQLEVDRWYRPHFIFQDGSPLLNLVAWANLYNKSNLDRDVISRALEIMQGEKTPSALDHLFKQFPELFAICALNLNQLRLPDEVVFLDVPPEVCISRISLRGKHIQPHENINHLTQLRSAYQRVCKSLHSSSCNVTIVDGDKGQDEIAETIIGYLKIKLVENNAIH